MQTEWINFLWRGERIPNIRVWATEHGQRMIKYRHTYKDPMFGDSVFEGEMPQYFWDHLMQKGNELWEELHD